MTTRCGLGSARVGRQLSRHGAAERRSSKGPNGRLMNLPAGLLVLFYFGVLCFVFCVSCLCDIDRESNTTAGVFCFTFFTIFAAGPTIGFLLVHSSVPLA